MHGKARRAGVYFPQTKDDGINKHYILLY